MTDSLSFAFASLPGLVLLVFLAATGLTPVVLMLSFPVGFALKSLRGTRAPSPLIAAMLNLWPLPPGLFFLVSGRFVFNWSAGGLFFLFGITLLPWGLGYGYLGRWRNLFFAGLVGAVVVALGAELGASSELVETGFIALPIAMVIAAWLVFGSTAALAWHAYDLASTELARSLQPIETHQPTKIG